MLVRFVVKNFLSFQEETEFDMYLSSHQRSKKHHVIEASGEKLLRYSAIYGANAAGKSNLIKAMDVLVNGVMRPDFARQLFSFRNRYASEDDPQLLGIEFFFEGLFYQYAIECVNGRVLNEELLVKSSSNEDYKSLYTRHKGEFAYSRKLITESADRNLLDGIEIWLKEESTLFYTLSQSNYKVDLINKAAHCMTDRISVVYPDSAPDYLIALLYKDQDFVRFCTDILQKLDVSISKILIKKTPILDFFGENDKVLIDDFSRKLDSGALAVIHKIVGRSRVEPVLIERSSNGEVVVNSLCFEFYGRSIELGAFTVQDLSDGTMRLLELLLIFYSHVEKIGNLYIIDEIERSIHPNLIRKLLEYSTSKDNGNAQLIFSTHESVLCDQDLFRLDEIWLTEKDKNGSTKLYPMSEFDIHHTTKIRKGYLQGRFGGVPNIGNLENGIENYEPAKA